MSGKPSMWTQPLRYMRWAHVQKPAIFYSMVIGSMGPVFAFAAPPIRARFGDYQRPEIPSTYPIPSTPRNANLTGYDD